MQDHTSNKGLNTIKAQTNTGRALQDRPLLETRKLPPGTDGREKTTTSMEHRAFEEVSSIKINHFCNHESNLLI